MPELEHDLGREHLSNETTAIRVRDRLWCLAACEVLDIADIAKLTTRFNKLRKETPTL